MATQEYKVLTSAITVVLKKGEKAARVLRGRIITLDDEITNVAELLRLKAIGVKGTKGLKPTTARVAAAAAGAEDDPVVAPDSGVPLTPDGAAAPSGSAEAQAAAAAEAAKTPSA